MKELYTAPELKLISLVPVEELALQIPDVDVVADRHNDPAQEGSDDLSFEFP